MTEEVFWEFIEEAWNKVSPSLAKKRMQIAYHSDEIKEENELAFELAEIVDTKIVDYLTEKIRIIGSSELREFDRILEEKLYDIDREDIQEFTDGSDDGFLYARGFIVGMGKEYYNKIKKEPNCACAYIDAESFCYFPWHLYHELYGEYPESKISRETGSNPAGWS